MSQDGKILARAREIIGEKKRHNQEEYLRRRAEIYARIPEIRTLDSQLSALMANLISDSLRRGEDAVAAVRSAQGESERISKRRAFLLKDAGYPEDYTDEKYDCPDCRDTGYIMGKPCKCLKEISKQVAMEELASVLDVQHQSFDLFNLNYYDDTPQNGISAKDIMSRIFETCREFALNFGKNSMNLLFRGGTGLGKTFLSASIAEVVCARGFSVVYGSAVSLLATFEDQKFDRGEGTEAATAEVNRCLNCDLLIIDDLGTELTTGFTQSALYTLINTRLINGRKTVISTNLSELDMQRRYSPQIISRLEGEFITLQFAGDDIRAIKRDQLLS